MRNVSTPFCSDTKYTTSTGTSSRVTRDKSLSRRESSTDALSCSRLLGFDRKKLRLLAGSPSTNWHRWPCKRIFALPSHADIKLGPLRPLKLRRTVVRRRRELTAALERRIRSNCNASASCAFADYPPGAVGGNQGASTSIPRSTGVAASGGAAITLRLHSAAVRRPRRRLARWISIAAGTYPRRAGGEQNRTSR